MPRSDSRPRPKSAAELQRICDSFNRSYPVGTPVQFFNVLPGGGVPHRRVRLRPRRPRLPGSEGGNPMPSSTDRQFLQDQLKILQAAQERIEETMRPYHDAIAAIVEARDLLLEKFEAEVIDHCGSCGVLILAGDPAHVCMDGEPVFCEACAPTWRELLQEERDNTDREDYAELMASIEAHVANGGSLDDKCVRPMEGDRPHG